MWASELNEFNTGPNFVNGTCGGGPFFLGMGEGRSCEEFSMKVGFSSVVFRVDGWTFTVLGNWVYGSISGPTHRLDVTFKGKGDAASRYLPHGIVGQSFTSDMARHGLRDFYPLSGRVRTRAQAEGAIEGDASMYEVAGPFATEFRFSRFTAALVAVSSGDASAINDGDASAISDGDASAVEAAYAPPSVRRLAEAPCAPPPPPSCPPGADGILAIDGQDVYCSDGCALAMRVASSSTFTYDSPYWTDGNLLNVETVSEGNSSNTDGKFHPFVAFPASRIRGCFEFGCAEYQIPQDWNDKSLQAIFKDAVWERVYEPKPLCQWLSGSILTPTAGEYNCLDGWHTSEISPCCPGNIVFEVAQHSSIINCWTDSCPGEGPSRTTVCPSDLCPNGKTCLDCGQKTRNDEAFDEGYAAVKENWCKAATGSLEGCQLTVPKYSFYAVGINMVDLEPSGTSQAKIRFGALFNNGPGTQATDATTGFGATGHLGDSVGAGATGGYMPNGFGVPNECTACTNARKGSLWVCGAE